MEQSKYLGIYSSTDRKYKTYGRTAHGTKAIPLVERLNPSSILDIGCGWNNFLKDIKQQLPNTKTVGVDFACPGADVIADVTVGLPFVGAEFDLATSFDVLEHLVPDDVNRALNEIHRVSRKFVFSICYRDSVNRWKGLTLHPTVRPQEWWIEQIYCAGAENISVVGKYITGTWHTH